MKNLIRHRIIKILFLAFLGKNQFLLVGLRFLCWFYEGNTQRLTESDFMEKPGIEPATSGLPTRRRLIPYITAAYLVSDLGLHCLPISHKKDTELILVKIIYYLYFVFVHQKYLLQVCNI